MLFCVERKHFFIIDLHSGMGRMTPSSNLCCTNMEDTRKQEMFTNKITIKKFDQACVHRIELNAVSKE